MATNGTHLSLISNLVNNPNANIPSKGPYVYPATVNKDLITLSSFMALNNKITPKSTNDINKWTYFLVTICFSGVCLSNSIISTQKDVVSDVSAESALE